MRLRGGPGIFAALHLARLAAGVSPAVLRRGGIATAIGMSAARSPGRPALIRAHDSMTGRELDAALHATAAALAERWAAGSSLGVRGDGGIDFLVVLGAAGLAGLDAVALGPRSPVVDGESVDAWEVFVREGREGRPLRWRSATRGRVGLLSTGTTGEPTLTRRGRIGARGLLQLADADRRLRIPDGPMLVLAPPDHGHGLSMVLAGLIHGRSVVLASGMRPAEQAELLALHRPRTLSGVPAQLARLLDAGVPLSGIELVVSGSSRLPPELRTRMRQQGARVLDCYGSTETGTVAIEGRALAGVTIEVKSAQSIRITSPLGGRPRTPGDLGRLEGGRLVVTGRSGDVVDSGGELVSASRVERVLRDLPGVAAARVWAEDDDLLGSRLCAEVTLTGRGDRGAIERELTARLGRASVPRTLHVSRE